MAPRVPQNSNGNGKAPPSSTVSSSSATGVTNAPAPEPSIASKEGNPWSEEDFRDERKCNAVPPPPSAPLTQKELYPKGLNAPPNWRLLSEHLQKEGRVTKEQCLSIVSQAAGIIQKEPNLLTLKDPITVVGDIHGQYYDFLHLLDHGGDPDKTQYLFLGDYVDRGSFSLEVIIVLFAMKCSRPQNFWLLRGNHECRQMTAYFNFRDECEVKQDVAVYNAIMDAFDTLPLAAVINGKFLAVHGGLSPEIEMLKSINNINRFSEPPRTGAFCDILWSDPSDEEKHQGRGENFFHNDVRGCSYFFGYEAATRFLDANKLFAVIRAHEAQLEGYKQHRPNAKTNFPTVITIFSAPNYCDCYNNMGAILKFKNDALDIKAFRSSPHPYHLPNFMDVFSWSIPFVSEKVTEMLMALLRQSAEAAEEGDEDEINKTPLPIELSNFIAKSEEVVKDAPSPAASDKDKVALSKERADQLRRKVQSVSRLMRMFKTLRENHETVIHLKGLTPGHRLPLGVLLQGQAGLQSEIERFSAIKDADQINERRPDVISVAEVVGRPTT